MKGAFLTGLVTVLILAAGCGGGDDEQSPQEAWAAGFCSAAADWRAQLEDIVGQFQSPADLTPDSIRSAVDDGVEATRTFVDDVRALGPPETESSQEAGQILDSMTSDLESTADDLSSTFDSSGDSLQDLLGQVAQAGSQLSGLASELQSSLTQLEDLQGGELRDAIESNSDCQTARGSS